MGKTPRGNLWLELDGFGISYNSFSNGEEITLYSSFSSDQGSSETALYIDGNFYILNGDFRSEYEELVDFGKQACLQFFYNNSEFKSSWSD